MPRTTFIAAILGLMFASTANATLRCGTHLVSAGDPLQDVLSTCGAPTAHTTEGPTLRANGLPRKDAQKIDIVVYGPSGGAYQYLLFVSDKLVNVQMRRTPPPP